MLRKLVFTHWRLDYQVTETPGQEEDHYLRALKEPRNLPLVGRTGDPVSPYSKGMYRNSMIKNLRLGFVRIFAVAGVVISTAHAAEADYPPIPEFFAEDQKAHFKDYLVALDENALAQKGYMQTLNEKYLGALERAKERMIKIRAQRAVQALEGEIARINAGDTERSGEIDAAPDYVREMRGQYEQFIVRVNNVRRNRDALAKADLDEALASFQVQLTKADEIDKAMQVREYRRIFARPPAPPEPVEEATPPESVPEPEPEPSVPDLLPPEPVDPPAIDVEPEGGDIVGRGEDEIPRPMTSEEREQFAAVLAEAPERSGRGYSAMISSIERGEVTEIKLSKIKSWGKAIPQIWKGRPVWTATVSYPTVSLFGTFDTEGMAIIDGGQVIEWLYTGSGEEIP